MANAEGEHGKREMRSARKPGISKPSFLQSKLPKLIKKLSHALISNPSAIFTAVILRPKDLSTAHKVVPFINFTLQFPDPTSPFSFNSVLQIHQTNYTFKCGAFLVQSALLPLLLLLHTVDYILMRSFSNFPSLSQMPSYDDPNHVHSPIVEVSHCPIIAY